MYGRTRTASYPRRLGAVMLVSLSLLCSSTASAQAMRCGSRLVTRGDHSSKLAALCGEPDTVRQRFAQRSLVTHFGEHVIVPGYTEEVVIEEWTYNFGPHRLMRKVTLENDIVADIRHLGYGFNAPP